MQYIAKIKNYDAKQDFAAYIYYYKSTFNKIVNVISYLIIVLSLYIFMTYMIVDIRLQTDNAFLNNTFVFTFGAVVTIPFIIFYALFDILAGFFLSLLLIAMYFLANIIKYFIPHAWAYALILPIFALIEQCVSNRFIDRNAYKSVNYIMNPIFIILDGLFWCGYRKNLFEEINTMATQYEQL
jgi:uncharacterized membrane protein YGL010W